MHSVSNLLLLKIMPPWETDIENRLMHMGRGGGEGEMYGKSNMETYITLCKIANRNLLYGSGNSNRGSVST